MIPLIIARKRDGGELTRAELERIVLGYVRGDVPDYQVAAWLMACYLNGLTDAETLALTEIMAASGETLDLSSIDAPTLDKHSTGGVGDKTSLVLVPLLAAGGVALAKMSGRGLGFTGGTVDKLESIPGYRTELTAQEMMSQVQRIGCCLVGQSASLAPADKLLYALRDATARGRASSNASAVAMRSAWTPMPRAMSTKSKCGTSRPCMLPSLPG